MSKTAAQRIQFGDYELDLQAGELRKGARRIRLQEQPFQILLMLLERPGAVVTREQICARLWPDNTIVEFEHSIATAIKKLRQALDDEAGSPRYVETLPRRGFRFIYPHVALKADARTDVEESAIVPSRARGELDESSLMQVTTSHGLDMDPSLSPDGSSIAYSSNQSGKFEIYVKSLAPGGCEMQLTNDDGGNYAPAWSPDGKEIAFQSATHGGIWLIPALGGTAHRLTDFGSRPAWSPDGTRIAFQPEENTGIAPSSIWIVSAQGGMPTQLTIPGNPAGGHNAPTWSPDGKCIAFSTTSTFFSEIWSVPVEGGQPIRMVGKPGGIDPAYSPDGRELYYSLDGSSYRALMRIDLSADGLPAGDPVLVKNTGQTQYRHLNFSAAGRFMAFTAMVSKDELASVRLNPVTGEAAGPPELLTHDTRAHKLGPMFSPDGKKIAYSVIQTGAGSSVWMMEADGKSSRPVENSENAVRLTHPGWMPDSQRLVIDVRQGSRYFLETLDIKTGKTERQREMGENDSPIRVSPDGKQIAFGRRLGGSINVWTAPIDGGAPRQLTFDKEAVSFPCWSPDGKFLAIENHRGSQIAVIPSAGGAPIQLTSDPGMHLPWDWSPDGDKVVYAGQHDGLWNIWWVSVRTRQEQQVTDYTRANGYVFYPTWSPRGDQIVFEYAETTGNIWTMRVK